MNNTSNNERVVKHEKYCGAGTPSCKIGCYTPVAKWKFLGSTHEFLGWPHRDAQGGLVLAGVYLRPMTARCCLTQPGPREDHTCFSVVCFPYPHWFWVLEHSSLFGGFNWWALVNFLISKAACSLTRS